MKSARDIEKSIKKLTVESSDLMHDRILDKLLGRLVKSKKQAAFEHTNIWRIIMKNRMARISTAAAVIVLVVVGVSVMDRSASQVYAIEQTVQALRLVTSVRAHCTDWDGSKGQVWVKIDPETGNEECYHSDQGNLMIVATPQKTYYYHKDKNLVRVRNEYVPAAEVRFSKLFEDLPDFIERLNGRLEIQSVFDEDLQRKIVRIWAHIPQGKDFGEKELVIRVDPETKLPINTETIKGEPNQGVKSVDRIEYNVKIPNGLFDFEIPQDAEVVYE